MLYLVGAKLNQGKQPHKESKKIPRYRNTSTKHIARERWAAEFKFKRSGSILARYNFVIFFRIRRKDSFNKGVRTVHFADHNLHGKVVVTKQTLKCVVVVYDLQRLNFPM